MSLFSALVLQLSRPQSFLRREWVKIRMLSNIMEPLRFNVLLKPLFCSIPFRPATFFREEIMESGICSPCERRVRQRQHGGSRYVTRFLKWADFWDVSCGLIRELRGAGGLFQRYGAQVAAPTSQNWAPIKDKFVFFLFYVKFSSSLPHSPHWYSFSGNLVVCCCARTSFVRSAFRLPEETSIKALLRMKSLCTRIILPFLSMDLKTDTL